MKGFAAAAALLLLQAAPPPAAEAPARGDTASAPRAKPEAAPAEPAPERLPAFVASMEILQEKTWERVALFDDGTIARVTRAGDDSPSVRKKRISAEELGVLGKVLAEAAAARPSAHAETGLLLGRNLRKFTIEIARAEGDPARFEFDDLSPLPLSVGRARGVLEDLLERFREEGRVERDRSWDAALLKEGDRLKRRGDGKVFRVVRDDRMSPFLELEEEGKRLERLKVTRKQAAQVFEAPLADPAAEER